MTKVTVQRSAGGVIYREREGEMWAVLIATRGARRGDCPRA